MREVTTTIEVDFSPQLRHVSRVAELDDSLLFYGQLLTSQITTDCAAACAIKRQTTVLKRTNERCRFVRNGTQERRSEKEPGIGAKTPAQRQPSAAIYFARKNII